MRRLNHALLPLVLTAPLALVACGDGTDPATTGSIDDPAADGAVVVAPPDPTAPADPAAVPPADDTTLQ